MSLRLMTFVESACILRGTIGFSYILVAEMLQQFEFSVRAL